MSQARPPSPPIDQQPSVQASPIVDVHKEENLRDKKDNTRDVDRKAASQRPKICSASDHVSTSRNLVVCIDGTTNQFGKKNTNVIELYSLLEKDDSQLTWYNSGIGTYAKPSWRSWSYVKRVVDQTIDTAIAWNFESIVKDAYRWLSDKYKPGDRIFLFGFSRGAYQVRALSGMIHKVGLIHSGNEKQIPFAYQLYADPKTGGSSGSAYKSGALPDTDKQVPLAEKFKTTFCREAKVHFVGVWDTVSSVGVTRSPTLPHTTDGMDHVCFFRQALALDELRVKYLPEYAHGGASFLLKAASTTGQIQDDTAAALSSPADAKRKGGDTSPVRAMDQVREVWFAGSHSDIGGGNAENSNLDSSRPPLRWICFQADAAGLRLRPFSRDLKPNEIVEKPQRSLRSFWHLLEYVPFKRLTYKEASATTRRVHKGKGRIIVEHQKVHFSVINHYGKKLGSRETQAPAEQWPESEQVSKEQETENDTILKHGYRPKAQLFGQSWKDLVEYERHRYQKARLSQDGKFESSARVEVDLYDTFRQRLEEYKSIPKNASKESRSSEIRLAVVSAEGRWVLRQQLDVLTIEQIPTLWDIYHQYLIGPTLERDPTNPESATPKDSDLIVNEILRAYKWPLALEKLLDSGEIKSRTLVQISEIYSRFHLDVCPRDRESLKKSLPDSLGSSKKAFLALCTRPQSPRTFGSDSDSGYVRRFHISQTTTQYLAASFGNDSVRLWNIDTETSTVIPSRGFLDFSFSPNNCLLALYDEYEEDTYVVSSKTGDVRHHIWPSLGDLHCVQIAWNNTLLFCHHKHGEVYIHDLSTDAKVDGPLDESLNMSGLHSLTVSASTPHVLTSYRGTIKVWDIPSGKSCYTFDHTAIDNGATTTFLIGNHAGIVELHSGHVQLCDFVNKKDLSGFRANERALGMVITTTPKTNPDPLILLALRNGVIQIWNGASGRCLGSLRGYTFGRRVIFSTDGSKVISEDANNEGSINVWNVDLDLIPEIVGEKASTGKAKEKQKS